MERVVCWGHKLYAPPRNVKNSSLAVSNFDLDMLEFYKAIHLINGISRLPSTWGWWWWRVHVPILIVHTSTRKHSPTHIDRDVERDTRARGSLQLGNTHWARFGCQRTTIYLSGGRATSGVWKLAWMPTRRCCQEGWYTGAKKRLPLLWQGGSQITIITSMWLHCCAHEPCN